MRQTRYRLVFPGQRSPLGAWLAALLAVVGFAVAMTLGLVFFVFFLALALVVAGIVAVRVWWFKRRLGMSGGAGPAGQNPGSPGATIEGDYQVLDKPDVSSRGRDANT